MRVDCDKALKPVKKLRKLLKAFPGHPTTEDVHALRTQCRKFEAAVHALEHDGRKARRIVRAMKPLRKAAGHVRDLDVLIQKTMALNGAGQPEAEVLLVERLAERRAREASRLQKLVKKREARLRRLMKAYQRDLKKVLEAKADAASPAIPQTMAAELEHWPKLHASNLHDFRIRAKELRYILQLSPDADKRQLDSLAQVKDKAGEWHDWLELEHMAAKIVGEQEQDGLVRAIHKSTREHLRNALSAANALRRQGITQLLPA